MKNEKHDIEKICGFYVNDWHLAVMLLPYIKSEIEQGKTLITFLEENIERNINALLSKLNFQEEVKNKIKNIKWQNKRIIKYSEIEKELKNYKNSITILTAGKREYIENVYKNIEKFIKSKQLKKIKILDCYEVTGFNKNIREVLDCHDKILNTAGEKQIEEVFKDYRKKETKEAINE